MTRERIARSCICCQSDKLEKSPAILMPFVAKRVFDHEPVMIMPEWGLRDIIPGMAYSICNSLYCTNCGTVFLDIRFSENEMARLYSGYRDKEYVSLREHFEPGYKERDKALFSGKHAYIDEIDALLTPHLPSEPAVLDWGGDTGKNTPLAGKARILHVYDISNKPPVPSAQAVNLAIAKSTTYDLVVCSQVLEHVPWPTDILTDIYSIMQKGTLLYLEVPYEEVMKRLSIGEFFSDIKHHWHEHINFFTEQAIKTMVTQVGLDIIELGSFSIVHSNNESGSILYALCVQR